MKLELLKVVVQAVVLERDDDGEIIGERTAEPTALYTADQVTAFMDQVRAELAAANAQANGGVGNRAQRRAAAKQPADHPPPARRK